MPKIVESFSGSTGIGASEIAAICHLSPWESAYGLWQKKTGRIPKPATIPAMQLGIDMESEAFEAYSRVISCVEMKPQVAASHRTLDYLRAIADGWDGENGVDIKIPSADPLLIDARQGRIPHHYALQLACCMEVFEVEAWDLFVYDPAAKTGIILTATWDMPFTHGFTLAKFWDQVATPLIADFWKRMDADKWEDDSLLPRPIENEWMEAIDARNAIKDQIGVLEERLETWNARLKQIMRFNSSLTCAGWTAKWRQSRASDSISEVQHGSDW